MAALRPTSAVPSFDVTPVKVHPPGAGSRTMMQETEGAINYVSVSLVAVIRRAYKVDTAQLAPPG